MAQNNFTVMYLVDKIRKSMNLPEKEALFFFKDGKTISHSDQLGKLRNENGLTELVIVSC